MQKIIAQLILLFVCASMQVRGTIIWQSDPTNNNYRLSFNTLLYEDASNNYVTPPATAVTSVHPVGEPLTWQLEKPVGIKRIELAIPNTFADPKEGSDVYIGWRETFVFDPTNNIPGFNCMQDKSSSGGLYDYPFIMQYSAGKGTFTLLKDNSSYADGNPVVTPVWSQSGALPEHWTNIVLHVLFSTNVNKGYVDVYYGGKPVYTNHFQATLDPNVPVNLHWGIYDQAIADWHVVGLINSLRIATTYREANPTNYPPLN